MSNNSYFHTSFSAPKSNTNKCTAILEYDKSPSKVSNNYDTSSSNTKSKSNERTTSIECDKSPSKHSNNKKNLHQFKDRNQMLVLSH